MAALLVRSTTYPPDRSYGSTTTILGTSRRSRRSCHSFAPSFTGEIGRPSRKKNPSDGEPPTQPKTSPYKKYEPITIHRSQLNNAPYNPRTISDRAKKRLKDNIKRVGLLGAPIWNARTGNIVGGHQRVAILDALEGTSDYLITVDKVDLDEKTEKEQNIFLNNTEAQGDFDLEALGSLLKEDKLDIESTGFDVGQIYVLFGDSPISEQPEMLEALADKMKSMTDRQREMQKEVADRNDCQFYTVVVFKSHEDRKAFTDALGLEDNRYVDGKYLTAKLGAEGEGPDIAENIA